MQYLPWICAGLTALLTVIALLCILPKRKSYQQELAEYKQSLYYRQTRNNYNKVASDPGMYGEYLTARLLERYAQEARFLYNLYIPHNGHTTEIDILMIHPAGVFVFESKNLKGKITGNDLYDTWEQKTGRKTYYFYSPILQNQTHVSALRKLIGQDVNVHPMVIFRDECTLKIRYTASHAPVIPRKQLLKEVQRVVNCGYMSMTQTKINQLYKQLKPYTQVSDEVKAEHQAILERRTFKCPECKTIFPCNRDNIPSGRKFEVTCPKCHTHIMMRKD